ncbi:MAG: PGPGW domain-containing protein [Acidobacteriota bacterium]
MTLGIVLILWGLLLAVPLVPGPGFLFILAGLAVLSPHSKRARWVLKSLRDKLRLRKPGAAVREEESGKE